MPLHRFQNNHIHNTQTTMSEKQHYPFFSSTLLDKIYTSMEEGCETKLQDPYRKTFYMKETIRKSETEQKNKVFQKQSMHQRRHLYMSNEFQSLCSTSSDSSTAGFSSSDGESVSAAKKVAPSCFAPFRLKQVRTHVAEKQSKKKQSTVKTEHSVSPGGRISSLISSLFTSSENKTNKNRKSSLGEKNNLPKCTSASSFARSCLSKNSPNSRDKVKNRDKRTVRFYPMIVTFDGDSKPCSRKWLEEGIRDSKLPILVPKEWMIGRPHDNRQNRKKGSHCDGDDYTDSEEEEEEDDASSCTSSDLFELDHLSVIGIKGCDSELPVFESTRIGGIKV